MVEDYSPWGNFRRRIEQLVTIGLRNNKSNGLARVYVELYLDATGNLVGWEEPDCRRMEPSRINWCDAIKNGGLTKQK